MNEAARAGIIDAGESTFVRVIPLEQDKSFAYVNDTAHSLFLTSIIVANGFWDTLDLATQEIMKDAALNAARIERRESVVDVASVKETLGDRVVEMSADETAKFKTATEVVYTKYTDYFSNDLINKIKSA